MKRLGQKSRFLLELNEMSNEGSRVATTLSGFFKCSAAQLIQPRFHSNLRTKCLFFADLSVSKTHFTDKPAFSDDLSVNFWPLWWEFTDKAGFLEHLSVKPGPKRLNFYGQMAIFPHFVRNRHFSGWPFTDKEPIFIDLSVNGSDFAKCSAAHHLLNRCTWLRLRTNGDF